MNKFEIQRYYKNKLRFNGVCLRNDLLVVAVPAPTHAAQIKDGACVINLEEYKSIGTHWVALYVNGDNVKHFESFEVEYNPKEIKNYIGNKNITISIYRIQANDSIMCGYLCIGFIDFMFKDKSPLYYTNLVPPN